jgi:hypothetical protein
MKLKMPIKKFLKKITNELIPFPFLPSERKLYYANLYFKFKNNFR